MPVVSSSKSVTRTSKDKPAATGKAAHAFRKKQSVSDSKMTPIDFVIADLKHYIKEHTSKIYVVPDNPNSTRHLELHPSSYPYCGLRHAWRDLKGIPREPMDFYGEYYTSLGTMKHELMQKYLGKGKRILGDWTCLNKECGHKIAFTTYKPCPKCKSKEMQYEELGIKFGKWTHGHIDGVVQINGKWFVLDYKTTGTKKNEKHRLTKNVYPNPYNVAQIESYVVYLEAAFDIKIEGWLLIYVSRDSSFRDYEIVGELVSEAQKKKLLAKMTRYDKHFGKVMKLKKDLQLKYFKDLVLEKPCANLAQYKKDMHSYNWCELAKSGVCFDRDKLRLELQNLVNIAEGRPSVVAEL